MLGNVAILGAAIAVVQLACPYAQGAPAKTSLTEIRLHQPHAGRSAAIRARATHTVYIRRRAITAIVETSFEASPRARSMPAYQLPAPAIDTSLGAPISLSYHVSPQAIETSPEVASHAPVTLSDQEQEVTQLAEGQGDRDFLMVDKALGKIILFENGKPVFAGSALTGESLTDRLPTGELAEKFDNLNALDTKVTPAGRYTVERGYDQEYGGPLLDVKEIKGKDWGIAIHKVWLGNPSEHRAERLRSPSDDDKHITFGCINVAPETIRFLLRELPPTGPIPLYILPVDPSRTTAYFAPHTS